MVLIAESGQKEKAATKQQGSTFAGRLMIAIIYLAVFAFIFALLAVAICLFTKYRH